VALFGKAVDSEMRLNDAERIWQEIWYGLPAHYAGLRIDAFIVMPNHIHGIIVLTKPVGRVSNPPLHLISPPNSSSFPVFSRRGNPAGRPIRADRR
jgi:REP-associated tyrosine transposase